MVVFQSLSYSTYQHACLPETLPSLTFQNITLFGPPPSSLDMPSLLLCYFLLLSLTSECCRVPEAGKTPWRKKWQPTPVSLPGKFPGQRSLVGYSPGGRKESTTTEHAHTHISILSPFLSYFFFFLQVFKLICCIFIFTQFNTSFCCCCSCHLACEIFVP